MSGSAHNWATRNWNNGNRIDKPYIDPHVSTRGLARETGYSKSSVHRELKQYKLHPYKATLVQGLRPTDFQRRMIFILKISEIYRSDSSFNSKIFWFDERKFCNNRIMNCRNMHYWTDQNPYGCVRRNTKLSGAQTCGVGF